MLNLLWLGGTKGAPPPALATSLISLHTFAKRAKFSVNSNTLSRNISISSDGGFALAQLKSRARRVMTDGGHKMCVLPVGVN